MMSVELVMFVIGSVGIAASVYGHFLYRHDSDQLVRSHEPRVRGADGGRRLRLVSTREETSARPIAVSGPRCHSVRKPR